MNPSDAEIDEAEITELVELAASKVSGVGRPANSTPWLLMKSALTSEPQTPQEKPIVKTDKSAKKAARKAARQRAARQTLGVAIKSATTARAQNVSRLKKLVKSAKSEGPQATRAVGYMLAREQLAKANQDERLLLAMQRGLVPESMPQAIAAASAGSIANALGPAVNRAGTPQRDSLIAVRDSKAVPQTLPGETELPSQVQLHRLAKQLRNAATPEERERIGYQLTRMNLIRAHKLGEI